MAEKRYHVIKKVAVNNSTVNSIVAAAKAAMGTEIEEAASMTPGSMEMRPGSLITIRVGDPDDPASTHQVTLEVPVKVSITPDPEQ